MAHVSNKLKNALEGALAGGGDPATSPLYVFGPFLRLIVVAGVAEITFGVSIWLVILTIAVVSTMYRLVMEWVTDGSGGSGLSEEEFGSWAVKVNAAITFVEYTLTFLVSMAAMVTFIADRIPILNNDLLGLPFIQNRAIVAVGLSILTGWLVNRGPRVAARTFGPATAGVLLLLWIMVFSAIWWQKGIVLPDLDLRAFTQELPLTLAGYARILAVMTGIEVFANLVAAYDGPPHVKSTKAFNSLLIIMGTTAITMLIVGPAIYMIADTANTQTSVFTQTMDVLLPAPLPYLGTLVGIAVLMSASAASAQGLQNLALGLRRRHYVAPALGQRNAHDVADKPVWLEVIIVSVCFLIFGTHEETYLAIYAAGVFILLSMTGWAVTKRLLRQLKSEFTFPRFGLVVGTIVAASLTTGATGIIFFERFFEGAWTYFLFIPMLYATFTYFRNRLGEPSPEMDYLGQLDAAQLAGFGFGQMPTTSEAPIPILSTEPIVLTWQPAPIEQSEWRTKRAKLEQVAVLLDGSYFAEQALPMAKSVCKETGARLLLLSSVKNHTHELQMQFEDTRKAREIYLINVAHDLREEGYEVDHIVAPGFISDATQVVVNERGIDLVVITTRGKSGAHNWLTGGASRKLVQKLDIPILLVHTTETDNGVVVPKIKKILVALDGSINSERSLPVARALTKAYDSELILLIVPQVPYFEDYRAPADVIETIRTQTEEKMCKFLSAVAGSLGEEGLNVRAIVTGSIPTQTITSVSEEEEVDLIMITSRGRGGLDFIMMGSVAERVVQGTQKPVIITPIDNQK